ncbi:urea amidolyase associated protein UAAP1 [Patulibacter defluvii]|uniref:urea amidolyase associated protein UAAP1 n=1 Tax=Patulibacter defluvii TaxID=3095358 RepID=UPI002A7485C5|nr:urea amidolyase associated protein UAAP1 [Patulibacter sp. DM4]
MPLAPPRADNPTPLLETTIPGGWTWSSAVPRGNAIRLTDLEGGANVALTALRLADPAERYCMGDTLKPQHSSRLTAGDALYSDMGRILLSLTEDEVGGHDPFGGLGDDRLLDARHGPQDYQGQRNDRWRSGREALTVELAKHGLGRADLGDVVNLFSLVDVAADGTTALREDHSPAGAGVVLRAELDLLVALYCGPHPHAGSGPWAPKPVALRIDPVAPPAADDLVRRRCPENARGLAASEQAARLAAPTRSRP